MTDSESPSNPTPPSVYPAIEGFIETATPDDVKNLFTSIREGLDALKGPKAEQAKKARKALDETEALLSHLLQVREKVEEEARSRAKGRK